MSAHTALDALRKALRASESRLRTAVVAEFSDIHATFGITPDTVQIDVFDVTSVGDAERTHVVGSVRVGITL